MNYNKLNKLNKIIYIIFMLINFIEVKSMSNENEYSKRDVLDNELIHTVLESNYNDDYIKIQRLIDAGANVNAKKYTGVPILIEAIDQNNYKVVELLLANGADVDCQDDADFTPLMSAIISDEIDMVKLLLKYNADINFTQKSITPLMRASVGKNLDIVKLLIEKGANLNAHDYKGITAYMHAKKKHNLEVIEYFDNLIIFYKDELYKSIKNKDYSNFKKYLLLIGSICIQDKDCNNLLLYAIKFASTEIAKLIYSIKPDLIGQVNKSRETPLSYIFSNTDIRDFFLGIASKDSVYFPNKNKKAKLK